jgi:ABC-type lipoprotein export system ATPase subunit
MNDTIKKDPIVRISNLRKSFTTVAGEYFVLRGVELDLYPGEMTAIMGPSGCGKSSMLYILGLLAPPTAGKYTLNGQEMFGLSSSAQAAARRRHLGFILQSCNLFDNSTVFENLEYPLIYTRFPRENREAVVVGALEKVGLSHRIQHRTNQLSGGEQQRVAIARALVNKPSVLLADEPTGQLDKATGDMVMDYFQQIVLEHDTTMLIVTHDAAVAEKCTRIYHMRDGVLVQA